jgi:hypothetical protein
MKPQQLGNRFDALTTQLYRVMIILEKCGQKIDDLAVAADDESDKCDRETRAFHLLRQAHAAANQVSYDLAGLHNEVQEQIYKIDSIVSDLSEI